MIERSWWERFLDSLDTSGGHLIILLVLLVFGAVVFGYFGIMKGEEIMIGSFLALLVLLKEVHSNLTRNKQDPKTNPEHPDSVGE